MSVQTYNETIIIPLGELFKNITNDNCYNLFNQDLTLNFLFYDRIIVNNQCFIRNYNITDAIVYETKDKSRRIELGKIKLFCKTKELDKTYIANCKKEKRLIILNE